jgi:hypothetical protein
MLHWTIEIDYTTGDTFGSEDITGSSVGYCWKDKELAIEALKSIEEHYELYQLGDDRYYRWRPERKKELDARKKELKARPWYDKQLTYSIKVQGNDGETTHISAFWCGYFETLNAARVVSIDPDADRMEFRP